MFIEELEEKIDEIKDSDIMIIEDSEDTKKVTIEKLKDMLQVNSDKKIEMVKDTIIKDLTKTDNTIKEKVNSTTEAYYSLVRNYEFLNSAYEELKEMFHDYISKIGNTGVTEKTETSSYPTIKSFNYVDGKLHILWKGVENANGYEIIQKEKQDDGTISTNTIENFEIPATVIPGTNNTVICRYASSEMEISIGDLEIGKTYNFTIVANIINDDGEEEKKYSADKWFTIE